jgi:UDP-N-acetylmuramoylalanine-D-glutamate ligase
MSLIEDITNVRQKKHEGMAANIAQNILQIRKESIKQSLWDMDTVSHRQEYFAEINNVSFCNDAKAETANATWFTFENIFTPTIWIAGGVDKGNDYTDLFPTAKKNVKALICLGKENEKLKQSFDGIVSKIYSTDSMEEAIRLSMSLAEEGDTVLLSPACEATDLFRDYAEKGNLFKDIVNKMK